MHHAVVTGELVFFGYRMEGGQHITVSTADASGKVLRTVGLNLPTPIMLHDCAITRDYFIIMDICLEFQPKVCCRWLKHVSTRLRSVVINTRCNVVSLLCTHTAVENAVTHGP